tara:strand:+ start:798 stop:968 length:171 start_codon:yes stop_codon:yes gene_type:complete
MAKRYRKITISVSNSELNRFEDFLFARLNSGEKKLARTQVVNIWKRLVKSWDKNKK